MYEIWQPIFKNIFTIDNFLKKIFKIDKKVVEIIKNMIYTALK